MIGGSTSTSSKPIPQPTFDTDARKIWVKRVDYDIDGAIDAIEDNGLPRILGERLRLGK